jgi:hypothetical protein
MMRMERYMREMAACSAFYSSRVHPAVARGTGLRTDACGNHFCGRFYLDGHREVSVSVPPDAIGNRERDHQSFPYTPTTIETMLVVDGELNGDSMQRFDSVSMVVDYINNLKNGISAAP